MDSWRKMRRPGKEGDLTRGLTELPSADSALGPDQGTPLTNTFVEIMDQEFSHTRAAPSDGNIKPLFEDLEFLFRQKIFPIEPEKALQVSMKAG